MREFGYTSYVKKVFAFYAFFAANSFHLTPSDYKEKTIR